MSFSHQPIRLTREIPLWGLVLMILGFAGQAVAMYYGLARQTEKLDDQIAATRALTITVAGLSDKLSTKDAKDAEQDTKINFNDKRLGELERWRYEHSSKPGH